MHVDQSVRPSVSSVDHSVGTVDQSVGQSASPFVRSSVHQSVSQSVSPFGHSVSTVSLYSTYSKSDSQSVDRLVSQSDSLSVNQVRNQSVIVSQSIHLDLLLGEYGSLQKSNGNPFHFV